MIGGVETVGGDVTSDKEGEKSTTLQDYRDKEESNKHFLKLLLLDDTAI